MNTKTLVPLAALALSGCCVCNCEKADPVIGNWSGMLSYGRMNATTLTFERGEQGEPRAFVLWRWGHPVWCEDVKIEGNRFSLRQTYGSQLFEGEVVGDRMYGRVAACDRQTGKITGPWSPFTADRNPPVPEGVKTEDAVLGEPVDILRDGLDGFTMMDAEAQVGWSFKDGILSNRVKFGPDGKKIGRWTNIMTKRADFFDFNLEYDVRVPKDANSGVYLRGRFEIQTVDSYGLKPGNLNMAAYYGRATPSVAAEKPAGEWQHVSVTLYRRHLTVVLNGTKIIDNVPVDGVTGGAIDSNLFANGPLYIQGDHTDADYRNMILRPAL